MARAVHPSPEVRGPSQSQNRSCSVQRLGCFCASDAFRPSHKVVIEGRISHFVASIAATKHGYAPMNFQNEKRQLIGGKVLAMCHPLVFFPGDESALM